MIELDRASLDRVLPATPGPDDWGDVMERFGAYRHRRRQRLVVLAAAALVAVVGTAAAIGSVRDFLLDRGFIGLPPLGATPSTPENAELVAHWYGRSATHGGGLVRVWVFADGRVVWDREGSISKGANELTSGYLEQRLTSDGVELLRSEVVASGLFDRSLSLLVNLNYGSVWGSAEVRDGDRIVRLRWKNPTIDPERDEGTNATPEQLSALRRVDALFSDPVSALPSSAWADREIRAYVASHYAVCVNSAPPREVSSILSWLPARAADLLRARSRAQFEGRSVGVPDGSDTEVAFTWVAYCSKVTTEEARELAQALAGLEPEPRLTPYALAYVVGPPGPYEWRNNIWFEPYLPNGDFLPFSAGR